ncbi:leucine-rich repeat and immunoglobulin-like domain-containing nogo receptor-interacting protein 4 [Dermacentor albipictus]|uniref:leucine-rich repeat and immunoglobulin-like domain-containing nogo receptor-interacting protein 4 n=1 Tax=Dermacentor albipictus TaxID=60249 RepID=UPI0031FBA393
MPAWPLGYQVCALLLASCHFAAVSMAAPGEPESEHSDQSFCSRYHCCTHEPGHLNMDCSARNASELQAVSVPAPITSLSLQHNRIWHLQRGAFASAPTVSRLDLSYNNIASMSRGWWIPVSGSRSNVTSGLRSLSLSNNAMGIVNSSSFHGLNTLVALDLSYNQLRILSGESFAGLTNLEELVVDHNPIYYVRGNAFTPIARLRVLQMNHLGHVVIPPNAFRFVPGVRTLGLAGNDLGDIPYQALRTLKMLRSLDVSRNQLRVITGLRLFGLPLLSVLRLNDQPVLTKVDAHAFGLLPNLKEVHLSYNPKLTELDPDAFNSEWAEHPVQLDELHLRQTGLSSLSAKLQDWNRLRAVDLSENAWTCDCRLSWMAPLVDRLRPDEKPRCAAPLGVKGRPVGDLLPYEFSCGDADSPELTSSIVMMCVIIATAAVTFIGMAVYAYSKRREAPRYSRFRDSTASSQEVRA